METLYHIISKVCIIDGELKHVPIGYVLTEADAEYVIDQDKIAEATQWSIDNIEALIAGTMTVNDFVTEKGYSTFYAWDNYSTTCVDGMGLSEITDLDNPEGV